MFCNVADIIEGNGATSYFGSIPEQHVPALSNSQTARTYVIMFLTVSLHVETVCLLSKLSETKNHISGKVDMDEMDATAAESKATYQEIQAWVQEHYGFHVSHLNIAKTKRKCGIIERKNYNLPKSEDSRSPETPKEKEDAIIEAFRHFQIHDGHERHGAAAGDVNTYRTYGHRILRCCQCKEALLARGHSAAYAGRYLSGAVSERHSASVGS